MEEEEEEEKEVPVLFVVPPCFLLHFFLPCLRCTCEEIEKRGWGEKEREEERGEGGRGEGGRVLGGGARERAREIVHKMHMHVCVCVCMPRR